MSTLPAISKLPLQWLRLACESAPKSPRVSVRDPWVLAISEHRSTGKGYSSCADLAHWWLTRLGYRRSFLNRSELRQGWVGQVNVGRICATPWGSRHEASRILATDPPPEPGDVCTVNADDPDTTHVCIPLEWHGDTVLVAQYGQPGGAVTEKTVTVAGKHWTIGSRVLHSCLRIDDLGAPEVAESFETWAASWKLEVPSREIPNATEKIGAEP